MSIRLSYLLEQQQQRQQLQNGDQFSFGGRSDCPDSIPQINFQELEIGKWIGSGGFCDVHAVTLRSSRHMDLAVKLVRQSNEATDQMKEIARKDVIHEAHILSGLSKHYNIIQVHGIARIFDNVCLVMDRLDTTLADRLKTWSKRRNSVGWRKDTNWKNRIEDVALGLLGGLQFLHESGIVHRDIKPSNVGFDSFDNVVLFDFGLAREIKVTHNSFQDSLDSLDFRDFLEDACDDLYEEDMQGSTQSFNNENSSILIQGITIQSSGPCGTVKYMAPEIAASEKYGVSADIYSFAIVLWQLVTLKSPFRRLKTRDAILSAAMDGIRPSLRATPNHQDLRKVIKACWHTNPKRRPTAKWLQIRLKNILEEEEQPKSIRRQTSRFHRNLLHEIQAQPRQRFLESH